MSRFTSAVREIVRDRHAHIAASITEPAPLTTWMEPSRRSIYPACNNGPCQQGDGKCPTPEACQIAEADGYSTRVIAGLVLAAVLFVAFALAKWWLS